MNRKFAWWLCLLALTLCSVQVRADTLYSNLGTGSAVYNCCAGWTVSGTGSFGVSFIAANEFQVTTSGYALEIDVAVGLVEGDNSFYLQLAADNGGHPGSVLLSVTNLSSSTPFGTCCGLVSSGILSPGVTLNTGTNYWLVIGPTDTTSTTWEAWNFSNHATGNDDYSTDGGLSWVQNGDQPQGAFQILAGKLLRHHAGANLAAAVRRRMRSRVGCGPSRKESLTLCRTSSRALLLRASFWRKSCAFPADGIRERVRSVF